MKRTIFFFAKIFEKKENAEALLDGKLYINRLSYFRKIEEEGGSNRSDRYEGVINWLQPDKVSLKINDFEIDSKDLVEPVSIQMNYHGNLNVFCIYAAHSGGFENVTGESLPDFREQLEISDDCLRLGDYAVLVKPREFAYRVKEAVQRKGYGMKAKLVDYYNPDEFSGTFTEEEVFKKRIEFQHQSEYRFSINTGLPGDGPLTLEIGDIRDIAHLCNTSSINKGLEINITGPAFGRC